MTPEEQSRANTRAALEETAKHFGLSVEECARRISEELMLRDARKRGLPDWVEDMARAVPTDMVREIALRDNRAPVGPSSQGIVPSSQQVSNVRGAGNGTGWARKIPLSNPPGTHLVDALCIADDVRQRAERKRGG
jgi:hypothetical protein